jgi:hypothetical protein
MRRYPVRKWFWVISGIVQALMLMIAAALTLPPIAAGIPVAVFLLVFSIARGVGSLSFQDVTGKTIPKGRRGRMLAARSMIGGLLTIAVGLGLKAIQSGNGESSAALILLFCGALLWSIAALAFAAIREEPGATEGGRNDGRCSTFHRYPAFHFSKSLCVWHHIPFVGICRSRGFAGAQDFSDRQN